MNKVMEFDQTCARIEREIKIERVHCYGDFQELINLAKEQSDDGYHFDAIESLKLAHVVSKDQKQAEQATYFIADNYLNMANDDMLKLESAKLMLDEANKWQKISESYHEELVPELSKASVVNIAELEEESPAIESNPTLAEKLVEKAAKTFYLGKFVLQETIKRSHEAKRSKSIFSWLGKRAVTFA